MNISINTFEDGFGFAIENEGKTVFSSSKSHKAIPFLSAKYDESWNWLMSVVEKIESLRGVVKMGRHWGTMVDDPLEEMYFCTIKIHKGAEIDVAWGTAKKKLPTKQ